jgi:L-cysteine S-thiosulfotransferase
MFRVFVAETGAGRPPGWLLLVTALAWPIVGTPVSAQEFSALERQVEAVVRDSWGNAPPAEARRLVQDDTQRDCSRVRNEPGDLLRARIQARERERISYPAGGLLLGDPVEGERIAKHGYGGRIGRLRPDDPARPNGGSCQACHILEPRDDVGGTLGPPLARFGLTRGSGPEAVRYVYERVYNPHAFNPCTEMPRFGHHGFLTAQQILDVAAYLLSPGSPVNRLEFPRSELPAQLRSAPP